MIGCLGRGADKIIKMKYTFKIFIKKEPEGNYTCTVPSLPGCITFGETIQNAIEMTKEAIGLYIEELQMQGEYIHDDRNTKVYSIEI